MYIVSSMYKDCEDDVSFWHDKLFNNYDKAAACAAKLIEERKWQYITDMAEYGDGFDPKGCFEDGSFKVFGADKVHYYLEIYNLGDVIGTYEVKVSQLTEPDD